MGDLDVTQLIMVPWLFYGVTDGDVDKKCDAIRRFGDESSARSVGVLAGVGGSAAEGLHL